MHMPAAHVPLEPSGIVYKMTPIEDLSNQALKRVLRMQGLVMAKHSKAFRRDTLFFDLGSEIKDYGIMNKLLNERNRRRRIGAGIGTKDGEV